MICTRSKTLSANAALTIKNASRNKSCQSGSIAGLIRLAQTGAAATARVFGEMSNKSGVSRTGVDSGAPSLGAAIAADGQKSENNASLNNPRYSLGARASLGPVKAGRLSQVNNEFVDSGKVSLSGRNSFSAHESRNSLSRCHCACAECLPSLHI